MRKGLLIAAVLTALATGVQAQETALFFERGVTKAAARQFEKALVEFQNALFKYDAAADGSGLLLAKINYNIGVCHYRLGRASQAADHFSRAVGGDPRYEKAHYALGMAYADLGKLAEAKNAFLAALAIGGGRSGETWFDLGLVELRMSEPRAAAESFANAIRYGTRSPAEARNNIGVAAAMRSDHVEAELQFRLALAESGGKLLEAKRNLELIRSTAAGDGLIAARR
ncbi:MAG: tetratricopeptide repeat protein [Pyrinomonadaceae bacterium]